MEVEVARTATVVGCMDATLSRIATKLGVEPSKLSTVKVGELAKSIHNLYRMSEGAYTARLSTWSPIDMTRPVSDFTQISLFYDLAQDRIFAGHTLNLNADSSIVPSIADMPLSDLIHPRNQTIELRLWPCQPPAKRTQEPLTTRAAAKRRKALLADGTTVAEASATNDGTYEVMVKTLTKTITCHVKSTDLVANLAADIQQSTGIFADTQRLIYAGRQLEHSQMLASYGIEKYSTIHLILRLRGGMMHISSGRLDYVSVGHRTTNHGQSAVPHVMAQHLHVLTGPESKDFVEIYAHPNAPIEMIKETLRMETDPNYFKNLSCDKLAALNNDEFRARMSHGALLRAVDALVQYEPLSEGQ